MSYFPACDGTATHKKLEDHGTLQENDLHVSSRNTNQESLLTTPHLKAWAFGVQVSALVFWDLFPAKASVWSKSCPRLVQKNLIHALDGIILQGQRCVDRSKVA